MILFVILVVVLCIAFVFATRQAGLASRKSALFERHSEAVRRLQALSDSLPECYYSSRVKSLILKEIVDHLEQQVLLQSQHARLKKVLAFRQKQLDAAMAKREEPNIGSGPKDVRETNFIRKRIHLVCKFLEKSVQVKKLDRSAALQEIQVLRDLSMQAAVSYHIKIAKSSANKNKFKAAVYYYTRAYNEYAKYDKRGSYQAQMSELQDLIDDLKEKYKNNVDKMMQGSKKLSKVMDDVYQSEHKKKEGVTYARKKEEVDAKTLFK